MNILTSLFSNKVAVFNIILVSAILIFLLIANVQQEVNIEEYATIPFDNTPVLEGGGEEYNGEVELVYDKDTFQIQYRIGKFPLTGEVIDCNESRPLPMSPATSTFYYTPALTGEGSLGSLSLALAIKKITEDPAIYSIKIEDKIICYFSDPFPTGYNSIIIYTTIEDKDKVRIEISKIRSLG